MAEVVPETKEAEDAVATDSTSATPDVSTTAKDERERTVWCIRHAQSEYNASVRTVSTWLSPSFWAAGFDPHIRDPALSDYGWTQVTELNDRLRSVDFMRVCQIDTVFVSPLRRAMDTALGTFSEMEAPFLRDSEHYVAHNLLREWMDTLGDVGSKVSDLSQVPRYTGKFKFPAAADEEATETEEKKSPSVDFRFVEGDVWWLPTPEAKEYDESVKCDHMLEDGGIVSKETKAQIHTRIDRFKQWLVYDYCAKQKKVESAAASEGRDPCDNVVIVGHSRWLREFVGAKSKLDNCGLMKVRMRGTDVVSYNVINFDKLGKWKTDFVGVSVK